MVAANPRPNKVTKRMKDRSSDNIIELIEVETPHTEDALSPDSKQQARRSQGIVIDGRTYTCATCKTGHRVGICKHARERPMKPTHPPGRPPAGAPKKVVCDCPKNCSCTKKDCKCARTCHCTQPMYMLVYVPAPEEDVDADEEKGQWKLGKQVTTDLKGNILTPEQVKERTEKKQAIKSGPSSERSRSSIAITRTSTPTSKSSTIENTGEPAKSCCKHKESVATRTVAAQALPQTSEMTKPAADGCNCGHACNCAFCPQHPNNATSTNVARQQAMYFANHSFLNSQSIVPFLPNMPQGASCMGGQPRFAISRNAIRPSFDDLQRTFPNPGYVIGYPIWSTRTDSAGFPVAPFPVLDPSYTDPGASILDLAATSTPIFDAPQMMPMDQSMSLDFSQDEFGIGNAFVASAGAGGWNTNFQSPDLWPFDNAAVFTSCHDSTDQSTLVHTETLVPQDQRTSQIKNLPPHHVAESDFCADVGVGSFPANGQIFPSPSPPSRQKSCCQSSAILDPPITGDMAVQTYFTTPVNLPASIDYQPYSDGLG